MLGGERGVFDKGEHLVILYEVMDLFKASFSLLLADPDKFRFDVRGKSVGVLHAGERLLGKTLRDPQRDVEQRVL